MADGSKHNKQNRQWWRKSKHNPALAKPKGNYAFIDSQNLNLGVQKNGWKMDWSKFRQWLTDNYGVTNAYMFIGYMQENESLYEQMYEHGFLVVLKPTVDIKPRASNNTEVRTSEPSSSRQRRDFATKNPEKSDESDKPQVKGNIDADLVLYAMKELPNYDKAVIVSGDGDFFGLVEHLVDKDRLLKLMTPNKRFSTLLQGFESYMIGLDQHRSELAYRDFRKTRRRTEK